MKFKYFVCMFWLLMAFQCSGQTIIKATDPHIHYMGRVVMRDSLAELAWSATELKISFNGTGVGAVIQDLSGANSYNVIVDGKVVNVIRPVQKKQVYQLATGLANGKHTLELFKRSEWAIGKTWFFQFQLDNGGKILAAPETLKHKIEFFGNSITCGYADEDTTGKDRGTGEFENGYLSYAALTARHFNAELYSTSKSGIGITVSWAPQIMPEMYDLLDPLDPNSKWNFSKFTPDVVVINLFQNDSWLVNLPGNAQFKARFGTTKPTEEFIINAYREFVKTIRSKYPKASIICILGSMDATKPGSAWPGYIDKAVAALNDKKIYTHFIPYKNTPGHPSVKEQAAMAADLEQFIDQNIKW